MEAFENFKFNAFVGIAYLLELCYVIMNTRLRKLADHHRFFHIAWPRRRR